MEGLKIGNPMLSPEEMVKTQREVGAFNGTVTNAQGKQLRQILNQEDFLTILVAELKCQDPTDPMKDRESIAQMASFSSLEQMTKMSQNMEGVSRLMAKSQAYSLLGKLVEINDGQTLVQGIVEEVSGGDTPQVLVNGMYHDVNTVQRVTNPALETAPVAKKGE